MPYKKKSKNNVQPSTSGTSNVQSTVSENYYQPLQTVDTEDIEDDISDNEVSEQKPHIPPITILKCKFEEINGICKLNNITNYSVRKISIGLKLFCSTKAHFDTMCKCLDGKYEHFSYATKEDKPYKALLFGLESQDPVILKRKLIALGLQCLDVKCVLKKSQYGSYVIFVVYFKRKSISIKELRQKYDVIDYIKVKWDYQTTRRNHITQCYNCQMFGHGSSHCRVKTFCANCAGNHQTKDCSIEAIKCANCNGPHKSTDECCPSKTQYVNIKQRNRPLNKRRDNQDYQSSKNYDAHFPNNLHQSIGNKIEWPYQREVKNNTNDSMNAELFSSQQLQVLTVELITNLRNCKSKLDQFNVITNLAFKFLP